MPQKRVIVWRQRTGRRSRHEESKVIQNQCCSEHYSVHRFFLTSIFSYKANYKASLDNIEQVSALTSEGIYYQMRTIFAKPVNVSYFMILEDGTHYFWMRIDAYTFLSSEDKCIHMFTYRKNIDEDKKRALQMTKRAETDEMTGFYTRTAAAMCLGIWPLKSLQQYTRAFP